MTYYTPFFDKVNGFSDNISKICDYFSMVYIIMLGGDCEMRTRIRDLREKKGLTLQELAAKVDMNLELERE